MGVFKDGFLTPEKKQYYLTELEKCKNCKHPDWDLDEGVLPILDAINANPNVQTILSKYSTTGLSYLQLTCTANVADKFMALVNDIVEQLYQFEDTSALNVIVEPHDKPSPGGGLITNIHLKKLDVVTKVVKYTSINRIMLRFNSLVPNQHNFFWEQMLRFKNLVV